MRVLVITPPTDTVVSWEDLDAQLRLGGDESERAYVEGLAAAAVEHLDGPNGLLGRALRLQTLEARYAGFGGENIKLPFPEIVSITSVTYLDADGVEQSVDAADYLLAGRLLAPSWGKSWPSVGLVNDAVRIRYQAGYAAVPASIKSAILRMVADMYQARESFAGGTVSAVPMSVTVSDLLQRFVVYG